MVASSEKTQVLLRLDSEDQELLRRCVRAEKLTMTEVLRRALRGYAKEQGYQSPREAARQPDR